MSTFVVSFVGSPLKGYRGRVRHVASGAEINFASLEALLGFFDRMDLPSPRETAGADPAIEPDPRTAAEGFLNRSNPKGRKTP